MLATVNERKACAQTSVPSLPPKTFLSLQDGNTSMILATQNGHTMIATLLLQKGADKYAKNNVSNCRHRQCIVQMAMKCACMHGWMPSQSGGPVETHPSNLSLQAGNTSMRMAQSHCACPRPSPPPPSQICSLQVGNTSMIMAAQNGYTEIAALLQEKGAVKVSHNSMLALPVCAGACG